MLGSNDVASTEHALVEIAARIDTAHSRGGKRLALFAANAPVALIMIRHLRAQFNVAWQGCAVLLSIDDPEWAELISITTIRQPACDIGYKVVEFVCGCIEGVTGDTRVALLPGTFVERVSTTHVIEAAS